MVLKSVVATLLLRTWQPVTWLAFATQAPERPRRLTRCYVHVEILRFGSEGSF